MRYILLFGSLISLLTACHSNYELMFLYVDPLQKILPEQNLFISSKPVAHVAHGEYATFQFAVRCNQPITDLSASIHSYTTDSLRDKLHLENVEISFIGNVFEGRYQNVPGNDAIYSSSQFYPDPLLSDLKINLAANTTSAIWVSIPISKNIPPGTYLNEVTVSGKVEGRSFHRSTLTAIKVYPIDIGPQKLFATNWHYPRFNFVNPDEAVEEYSQQWWEYVKQIAQIMHDYRLNVIFLSPLHLAQYTFDERGEVKSVNFERFDQAVNIFAANGSLRRITGGHIAERMDQWKSQFAYRVPEWDSINRQVIFRRLPHTSLRAQNFYNIFLRALNGHLEEKGWQNIYMQHIADEPISDNVKSYRVIAKFFKTQMPNCKIIEATHSMDIAPLIDIWVPQLDRLEQNYEFYRQQQLQGKELWYYTSIRPQGNYANRYIRQPLLKTRILHWINFKYNIDGYLHWGFNYWLDADAMSETTGIQTNGAVLPGGDAWIVYPYKRRIIPSIRLEAMRDGIADYELLFQLQKKDSLAAKSLVDRVVYGFQSYDISIDSFREIRQSLLTALESSAPE